MLLEFNVRTNLVSNRRRSAVCQVCAGPFRIETFIVGETERIDYIYIEAQMFYGNFA